MESPASPRAAGSPGSARGSVEEQFDAPSSAADLEFNMKTPIVKPTPVKVAGTAPVGGSGLQRGGSTEDFSNAVAAAVMGSTWRTPGMVGFPTPFGSSNPVDASGSQGSLQESMFLRTPHSMAQQSPTFGSGSSALGLPTTLVPSSGFTLMIPLATPASSGLSGTGAASSILNGTPAPGGPMSAGFTPFIQSSPITPFIMRTDGTTSVGIPSLDHLMGPAPPAKFSILHRVRMQQLGSSHQLDSSSERKAHGESSFNDSLGDSSSFSPFSSAANSGTSGSLSSLSKGSSGAFVALGGERSGFTKKESTESSSSGHQDELIPPRELSLPASSSGPLTSPSILNGIPQLQTMPTRSASTSPGPPVTSIASISSSATVPPQPPALIPVDSQFRVPSQYPSGFPSGIPSQAFGPGMAIPDMKPQMFFQSPGKSFQAMQLSTSAPVSTSQSQAISPSSVPAQIPANVGVSSPESGTTSPNRSISPKRRRTAGAGDADSESSRKKPAVLGPDGNPLSKKEKLAAIAKKVSGKTGTSCHQCKSRQEKLNLSYCMNAKTNLPGNSNRPCRKKYCDGCLLKFYGEKPPDLRHDTVNRWPCPACRGICTCAACKKLRTKRKRDDADEDSLSPSSRPSIPISATM